MPRWFDSAAHADPHRPVPLGRTALAAVAVYVACAIAGWMLVGVLAALLLA